MHASVVVGDILTSIIIYPIQDCLGCIHQVVERNDLDCRIPWEGTIKEHMLKSMEDVCSWARNHRSKYLLTLEIRVAEYDLLL